MKRDMDLVRKLVFAIEAHPHGFAPPEIKIDGHSEEEIGYHIHLMKQADLIVGSDVTMRGSRSPCARAGSLTWQGHEFADAARNDSLWNKAKKTIQEKAGTVSIAVLTAYLQHLAKQALGMP